MAYGFSPVIPLQKNEDDGFYALTKTVAENTKQNFKNLLLTSPGERMMNPDFGVGLRNFLFEPEPRVSGLIRQRIAGQVTKYMPFIKINKLLFNHSLDPNTATDSNVLSILVEFEVPSINLQSSLEVQAEDIS